MIPFRRINVYGLLHFIDFIWFSPPSLGPTNFISNIVLWKPFSTSAQKLLSFVVATTTEIYTWDWSNTGYPMLSTQIPTSSYLLNVSFSFNSKVSVLRLSAIHFRGFSIRQVSCYTLLSGFRLPWPPSCCLNEPTPFMVSRLALAPQRQE